MPFATRHLLLLAALATVGGVASGCGTETSDPETAGATSTSVDAVIASTESAPPGDDPDRRDRTGGSTGVVIAGGEVRINGSVVEGTGSNASPSGAIVGSGVIVTESRAAEPFDSLDLAAFGRVEVEMGATQTIEIDADDNVVALVRTDVVDNRLVVSMAPGTSLRNSTLRVRVTATALQAVTINGSSDVRIDGIVAPGFALAVRGSGDAMLAGTTDALTIAVDGSGDVDAAELIAQNAEVTISGSGDVEVHAAQSLDASIRGSGDITYRGAPPTVNTDVSGSGEVSAE